MVYWTGRLVCLIMEMNTDPWVMFDKRVTVSVETKTRSLIVLMRNKPLRNLPCRLSMYYLTNFWLI